MKLLKKALALGCVLAMAAAMFTGCDNGGGSSSAPKDELPKEEEENPDKDKGDEEDPDNNGGKDEELDISAFSEISVKTPPTITAYTLVNVDKVAFDSTGLVVVADNETVIPNNKLTFSDITANTNEVTITCGELTTKQAVEVTPETYNHTGIIANGTMTSGTFTVTTVDNKIEQHTGYDNAWSTVSKDWTLKKNSKLVVSFKNYGSDTQFYQYVTEFLCTDGGITLRADNFGWTFEVGEESSKVNKAYTLAEGTSKMNIFDLGDDWPDFTDTIKGGANVTVELGHYGNSIDVNVKVADKYRQYYPVICNTDVAKSSADVHFSADHAYLIFGTGSPAGDTATSQD